MDQSRSAVGAGGRSHLGVDSRITGELWFPGAVELPGYVNGRVEASEIVIETSGAVEGEIHAASITIKGQFKGKVSGGKVKLLASARVTGEIAYETLSIDSGAELEAKCTRLRSGRSENPTDQPSASAVD